MIKLIQPSKIEGLTDIEFQELKTWFAFQMLQVLPAPGEQIVHADHRVALGLAVGHRAEQLGEFGRGGAGDHGREIGLEAGGGAG